MALAASPEPQRKMTVAEAARYWGCSQRTIRNRIASGELPASRMGPRMIRLDPGDLDRLAQDAVAETMTCSPSSMSTSTRSSSVPPG